MITDAKQLSPMVLGAQGVIGLNTLPAYSPNRALWHLNRTVEFESWWELKGFQVQPLGRNAMAAGILNLSLGHRSFEHLIKACSREIHLCNNFCV